VCFGHLVGQEPIILFHWRPSVCPISFESGWGDLDVGVLTSKIYGIVGLPQGFEPHGSTTPTFKRLWHTGSSSIICG